MRTSSARSRERTLLTHNTRIRVYGETSIERSMDHSCGPEQLFARLVDLLRRFPEATVRFVGREIPDVAVAVDIGGINGEAWVENTLPRLLFKFDRFSWSGSTSVEVDICCLSDDAASEDSKDSALGFSPEVHVRGAAQLRRELDCVEVRPTRIEIVDGPHCLPWVWELKKNSQSQFDSDVFAEHERELMWRMCGMLRSQVKRLESEMQSLKTRLIEQEEIIKTLLGRRVLRVALFGASSCVGSAILGSLCDHGHAVRALVRDSSKSSLSRFLVDSPTVKLMIGDAQSYEDVQNVVSQQDAVVICVGGHVGLSIIESLKRLVQEGNGDSLSSLHVAYLGCMQAVQYEKENAVPDSGLGSWRAHRKAYVELMNSTLRFMFFAPRTVLDADAVGCERRYPANRVPEDQAATTVLMLAQAVLRELVQARHARVFVPV